MYGPPEDGQTLFVPYLIPPRGGCAAAWCEEAPGFQCGCPTCLNTQGLTLIWLHEDRHMAIGLRRRRIVRQAVARLSPTQICTGYPGSEERETPS